MNRLILGHLIVGCWVLVLGCSGAAESPERPAASALRRFLDAVAQGDDAQAYARIAKITKERGDMTLRDGVISLERFKDELTVDLKRMQTLQEEIANNNDKEQKLQALSSTPNDEIELGILVAKQQRRKKCLNYHLGVPTTVTASRVEIPLKTEVMGGIQDNDHVILVLEDGDWMVANPIHIVR